MLKRFCRRYLTTVRDRQETRQIFISRIELRHKTQNTTCDCAIV